MEKNNHQKGNVRVIIFKERNQWIGAALEFNIVEVGEDPREVMISIDEAVRGYIKCAKKEKLNIEVLNQKPEKEYEDLWNKLEERKPIPSSVQVYNYSRQSLRFA